MTHRIIPKCAVSFHFFEKSVPCGEAGGVGDVVERWMTK
jgi:hypothetical protein